MNWKLILVLALLPFACFCDEDTLIESSDSITNEEPNIEDDTIPNNDDSIIKDPLISEDTTNEIIDDQSDELPPTILGFSDHLTVEKPSIFSRITSRISRVIKSTINIFKQVINHVSDQIKDKYGLEYPYNIIVMGFGTLIILWISTKIFSRKTVLLS